MNNRKFKISQDYIFIFWISWLNALVNWRSNIIWEDLIVWIYRYLKKNLSNEVFYKFLEYVFNEPSIFLEIAEKNIKDGQMTKDIAQIKLEKKVSKILSNLSSQFWEINVFTILFASFFWLTNDSKDKILRLIDKKQIDIKQIWYKILWLAYQYKESWYKSTLTFLKEFFGKNDDFDIQLELDVDVISDIDIEISFEDEIGKNNIDEKIEIFFDKFLKQFVENLLGKQKKMLKNNFEIKNIKTVDEPNNYNNDEFKQSKIVTDNWNQKEEKKLTIEYFGTDLTKEAELWLLDPVIWRDKEIDQVIYTLFRKTKNNPLLIWEAGVWKTAIVEWLAQRIVKWEVPDRLKNKRIFMLDMWSLVAWTKYRWEFEARLKSILEEASDPTNNIILFIDELHTILWAWSAEWSLDAANMLKPLLARWKIQLIWATTFDEYQKYIEKDPALKRRFQEIIIEEPSREWAIEILKGLRHKFEEFHWVNISDEAIEAAVDLSVRYLMNKHLPDKAIDLLDEACARKSTLTQKLKENDDYKKLEKKLEEIEKQIEEAIKNQDYFKAADLKLEADEIKQKMKMVRNTLSLPKELRPTITAEDIWKVLSDKLWIPEHKVNESEIEKIINLEKVLKEKLLWQDEVIEKVVDTIKRSRLSVIKRNKPIASFLFLWPSWVWKTYLAKLIAKEFFGDEKALIRVDMSELMERHSVSKLIGSAPGYVWYEQWWVLTEAVRRRPYSVVLFDEIEKASPDVLNILLQILDEWYVKDNKGRIIDFKNTIVILTSNIWSEEFAQEIPKIWFTSSFDEEKQEEEKFEEIKERVLEKLREFLSPELLNRIDYIIVFKPLSKKILEKIFKQKLDEFLSYWKNKEWIKLPKFSKKRISQIIDDIYSPEYGARPIERYIHEEIEPQLINQVIELEKKKLKLKQLEK